MSRSAKIKETLDKEIEREMRTVRDGSRKDLSEPVQKYLKALVDTKNAKPCGVPTLLGGFPGRTTTRKFKIQGKFAIGTDGFGYVSMPNPAPATSGLGAVGPFNNGQALIATGATSIGGSLPIVGATIGTGKAVAPWPSEFVAFAPTSSGDATMQYRLVGMTLEVFPEASFSNQNGTLYLYEVPNHAVMNQLASVSIGSVTSAPTTRAIRAVQTGSQEEKIVLNWHPRALTAEYGRVEAVNRNDFSFKSGQGAPLANNLEPPIDGLIIVAEGDTGTTFHVTATSIWELKGNQLTGLKPRIVDSRGMDLVMNMIASKALAGYVGKPHHVYESYLWRAWDSAKKLGRWAYDHKKEISGATDSALKTIAGFI